MDRWIGAAVFVIAGSVFIIFRRQLNEYTVEEQTRTLPKFMYFGVTEERRFRWGKLSWPLMGIMSIGMGIYVLIFGGG